MPLFRLTTKGTFLALYSFSHSSAQPFVLRLLEESPITAKDVICNFEHFAVVEE